MYSNTNKVVGHKLKIVLHTKHQVLFFYQMDSFTLEYEACPTIVSNKVIPKVGLEFVTKRSICKNAKHPFPNEYVVTNYTNVIYCKH